MSQEQSRDDILNLANQMHDDLEASQKRMEQAQFTGEAHGIQVEANGHYQFQKVTFTDPWSSLSQEDQQKAVLEALQNTVSKIEKSLAEQMAMMSSALESQLDSATPATEDDSATGH